MMLIIKLPDKQRKKLNGNKVRNNSYKRCMYIHIYTHTRNQIQNLNMKTTMSVIENEVDVVDRLHVAKEDINQLKRTMEEIIQIETQREINTDKFKSISNLGHNFTIFSSQYICN